MKRLKEIFHRVAQAIPGASKPESLEEAQGSIVKDSSYLSTMKRWATNVGIAALSLVALGIFAKSGLVLAPALLVGGLYGAIRGGMALINRDIKANRVAEAEFLAGGGSAEGHEPVPEPSIRPDAELGSAFRAGAQPANENATRIRELEKSLADLEVQAEAKRKARELGLTG